MCDINPIGRKIKTFITFVIETVLEKYTTFGIEIKFVGIVWTKVGPTSIAKSFEKVVIKSLVIKNFKWGFILGDRGWKIVNEISRSKKDFIPI